MYYEIRTWKKIGPGIYESDQRTFDTRDNTHRGLYSIAKGNVMYHLKDGKINGAAMLNDTFWTLKRIDTDIDKWVTEEYIVGQYKTLKEAKEVAEKEFGCTFRLDEVDIAG